MRTPDVRLAAAALSALTVAGCLASELGAEGNLAFTYDTDDRAATFDAPIAIGGSIDLRAFDPDTSTPLPITSATLDDEGVIEIVSMESGRVTLRGIGEGTTVLRVSATLRGGTVSDAISIAAAPVRTTELGTGCADRAEGVYLARSRIQLPFELASAPGRPVIGYGVHPFELAPPSSLTLVEDRSMQYLAIRTGEHASRATIDSTVDDTRLVLEIVEEGAIDGARLRLGNLGDGVALGATRYVLAQPLVGDDVLCQGTPAFEVIQRSPAVCRAAAVAQLREDDDVGRTFGWVQIDGLSQGVCRFDVRYPNARGGAGLTMPFSMSVR